MSTADISNTGKTRSLFPDASSGNALGRGALPWPALIYLLCVLLPASVNVGPLALTLLRIFLLLVMVPLWLRILGGRYGGLRTVDVLLLLHIVWAGLAFLVVMPDRLIEQIGSVALEVLGGYAVGRAYIRTPADFAALCRTLVALVCLSAPFAAFETMTGRPVVLEVIKAVPPFNAPEFVYADKRLGLERVQFTFAHPIHYGLFCSIVLSLGFVCLRGAVSDFIRFITSAIVGVCGFLALSSGALLAIVLQLGLISWSYILQSVNARWWLLVALFCLSYLVIDILSNRTPIQVFMTYGTFSAHTAYWRSIIFEWGLANVIGSAEKGITGHPWFGHGLGDWIRPSYMVSGSMDNFWLVIAFRYGAPAFLLLAVSFLLGLGRIMWRDFSTDQVLTPMRRGWVFCLVGLFFTLATVHVWGNIYSFIFFIFGSGMWMLSVKPGRTEMAADAPPPPAASSKSLYTRFPGDADAQTRFSRSTPKPSDQA